MEIFILCVARKEWDNYSLKMRLKKIMRILAQQIQFEKNYIFEQIVMWNYELKWNNRLYKNPM